MGWVRYSYSEPSKKWRPGARKHVEQQRKRFQCNRSSSGGSAAAGA